jgi:Ca2+-binding EF-hand superfamily protein
MKLASAVVVLLLAGTAYAEPPPMQPAPRAQFRQLLLERFDRNHDGRLEKRERKQAARAMRRIAKQMMRADRRQERRARFIQRFDIDGDGNVGPGEMPPELANRLRSRDRNGDGWLEPNEQP